MEKETALNVLPLYACALGHTHNDTNTISGALTTRAWAPRAKNEGGNKRKRSSLAALRAITAKCPLQLHMQQWLQVENLNHTHVGVGV